MAKYNSFISIVSVIHSEREVALLRPYLTKLYPVLADHFSDFEIILVNNSPGSNINEEIESLDPVLKQNIFLINLSSATNKNHAIIAGLDRSNGDYTVLFEFDFYLQTELIVALFEKTRQHYDIVYLRAGTRNAGIVFRIFSKIFYWILKRYSELKVDERAHNTRIISRRALNSLLRLRENLRYMKAIYSIVGYRTTYIPVEESLKQDPGISFTNQFRTSLVAITSFTTFLRTMLLWIFIFSFLFLILVIINAVKVKLTNIDLFGDYHQAISGWTFLVILISVFFAVTCLNLYIMSIYLSNIYSEIKQRPLYIIESIKRF